MKKIAVTLAYLLSLVALAACSSSPQEPSQQGKAVERAARMVVVSSAKPADVLPAFTYFTWNDGYNSVLSAADDKQADAVQAYIRQELITYLKKKGYQYQPDPAQADVVFGFLFALEDASADKAIQAKFGLLPAVNRSRAPGYKKGTLLFTVLDTGLKKVYWRSALQGLADLEKERQNANSTRMQKILDIMLGGFAKAGR